MKPPFLFLIMLSVISSISANAVTTLPIQQSQPQVVQTPAPVTAPTPVNQQNVEAIMPILVTLISFIKIMLNPHDATNVTTNAAHMLDGIVQTVSIITRENERVQAENAQRAIALNMLARAMAEYAQTKIKQEQQ
jgi:hypothetical protein